MGVRGAECWRARDMNAKQLALSIARSMAFSVACQRATGQSCHSLHPNSGPSRLSASSKQCARDPTRLETDLTTLIGDPTRVANFAESSSAAAKLATRAASSQIDCSKIMLAHSVLINRADRSLVNSVKLDAPKRRPNVSRR